METRSDGSNSDKSVQMLWSLEDRISGNPRSYTCSFCKKGFSNAQALGGHMNIHRKDRAKLRVQFSDETMLSLDVGMGNQIDDSQVFEDKDVTNLLESITKGKSSSSSTTPQRSCSTLSSCKEDQDTSILPSQAAMGEVDHQQLPLFLDATSTDDDGKTSNDGRNDRMGLDLELRLGLEPHQETTTTTKSTIEFF
ncbi:hypothetical protein SLE2022_075170 [Rubroshorea leprosula]